ncbi:MAG: amidase [Proteobacteria bacterium]|nr:amidase [Pseudomonadota bacterium]MBI3496689.1 amidase [Pseudomonadota bacterium]
MTDLSFGRARERFSTGRQSPREFLEACLKRIEEREPTVKAFVAINPEGAKRAADAASERYRAGKPLSLIDGMPVAIKDIIETLDLPTEFGSSVFKGWNGGRDSAAAYALRQAGAVIVGKAVTTEFAGAPPGPTTNPHDPKRTPGGSSSGSAACVAAGMVPVALGTQVGGSVLRPASFCGIVGFKPTFGALNRGGSSDNFSQNCLGTLSRTIEDAWAVCHEIALRVGGDPGFPAFAGGAAPAGPRRPDVLAVLETAGWAVADAGAKVAFEAFLPKLTEAGVSLVNRRTSRRVEQLERALADAMEISQGINDWEKLWPFAELDHRAGAGLSPGLRKAIADGRAMTPDAYAALLRRREHMRSMLQSLTGDVDACITLAAPGIAPLGLASTGNAIFNLPGSALRTPALSLPLLMVDKMPLGVQLIGYPGRDRDLSAIAGYVLGLGGKERK